MSRLPRLSVVRAVAVLDHNIAARIVIVYPPAALKVIKEYIVLNDDIRDAVDIDMLVAPGLVVEHIAFDCDLACPVIYLQEIVVVAVMDNIIPENDVLHKISHLRVHRSDPGSE